MHPHSNAGTRIDRSLGDRPRSPLDHAELAPDPWFAGVGPGPRRGHAAALIHGLSRRRAARLLAGGSCAVAETPAVDPKEETSRSVVARPEAQAMPSGGTGTATFVGRPLTISGRCAREPALTIALVTGALVGARLLAVSAFRVEVALALLTSAGIANVLVGTGISLIPLLAPVLGLLLFGTARDYYRSQRRALLTDSVAIILIMTSVIVTPVAAFVAIAVLLLILRLFLRMRAKRGRPVVPRQETPLAYALVVGWPLIFALVTNSTPWLAPEMIAAGGSTTVGYVTQADTRWTQVLLYTPRVVHIYETSAITSRTLCLMPPNALNITLIQLVGQLTSPKPTTLPDCPGP